MKVDIIGDIHGCYEELCELMKHLGYQQYRHPLERKLIFLGDLMDRGPNSMKIIKLVYQLVIKEQCAYYVPGNHCNKLYRYFLGNNVKIQHGPERTIREFMSLDVHEQMIIRNKCLALYESASLYLQLPQLNAVVAHAGIKEEYTGRYDKEVKTFVLYGDITGTAYEKHRPIRRDWAKHYSGDQWIIYGHTPVLKPRFTNKTVNIDTGCVFGNALTAFRLPEKMVISIPSKQPLIKKILYVFIMLT